VVRRPQGRKHGVRPKSRLLAAVQHPNIAPSSAPSKTAVSVSWRWSWSIATAWVPDILILAEVLTVSDSAA
jgi:hypothetical protein